MTIRQADLILNRAFDAFAETKTILRKVPNDSRRSTLANVLEELAKGLADCEISNISNYMRSAASMFNAIYCSSGVEFENAARDIVEF